MAYRWHARHDPHPLFTILRAMARGYDALITLITLRVLWVPLSHNHTSLLEQFIYMTHTNRRYNQYIK